MRPNDLLRADDPAMIVAEAKNLAFDARVLLEQTAVGAVDARDASFCDLLRRAEDLQRLLGEGDRLQTLRQWLEGVQRQIRIMQWLGDPPGADAAASSPGRARFLADAAAWLAPW